MNSLTYVKQITDFAGFLGRLARHSVAITLFVFDAALFSVGWWWKARYHTDFPVPTWSYAAILGLGLLLAVYSSDRMLRTRILDLETATTPNLLFKGGEGDWGIANLGQHPAHIRAIYIEQLSRDETVVGHGLLMTPDRMLWGWDRIIGPIQEIDIRQEVGVPVRRYAPLSGLVRLVFYFVYGPTGSRTHALDVKLRIGSFAATTVISQAIRQNEPPPQLPPTSIDQIQPVARS